ncbi:DUF6438 domain-containing protein [Aquimarina hainanensis]|uniref:DUF6438 domain-containing protein n=1 Tax=Aquimarina hainanensis TaxID=1578017 RepID=A0ABW5NFZ2_9FLAO|nr:DUF6438 domain-containing protein [Aquimarina sp. TRL1]QKX05511.1 hypothetical protein HN014_11485 [Aquimarina sp. TRL1]
MRLVLIVSLFITIISCASSQKELPSSYIKLSKTSCLGTCPVYDIKISKKGLLLYNGINHVPTMGVLQKQLSDKELNKIISLFETSKFKTIKPVIKKEIRDIPKVIISYENQLLKFHGNQVPESIQTIITYLEAIVQP